MGNACASSSSLAVATGNPPDTDHLRKPTGVDKADDRGATITHVRGGRGSSGAAVWQNGSYSAHNGGAASPASDSQWGGAGAGGSGHNLMRRRNLADLVPTSGRVSSTAAFSSTGRGARESFRSSSSHHDGGTSASSNHNGTSGYASSSPYPHHPQHASQSSSSFITGNNGVVVGHVVGASSDAVSDKGGAGAALVRFGASASSRASMSSTAASLHIAPTHRENNGTGAGSGNPHLSSSIRRLTAVEPGANLPRLLREVRTNATIESVRMLHDAVRACTRRGTLGPEALAVLDEASSAMTRPGIPLAARAQLPAIFAAALRTVVAADGAPYVERRCAALASESFWATMIGLVGRIAAETASNQAAAVVTSVQAAVHEAYRAIPGLRQPLRQLLEQQCLLVAHSSALSASSGNSSNGASSNGASSGAGGGGVASPLSGGGSSISPQASALLAGGVSPTSAAIGGGGGNGVGGGGIAFSPTANPSRSNEAAALLRILIPLYRGFAEPLRTAHVTTLCGTLVALATNEPMMLEATSRLLSDAIRTLLRKVAEDKRPSVAKMLAMAAVQRCGITSSNGGGGASGAAGSNSSGSSGRAHDGGAAGAGGDAAYLTAAMMSVLHDAVAYLDAPTFSTFYGPLLRPIGVACASEIPAVALRALALAASNELLALLDGGINASDDDAARLAMVRPLAASFALCHRRAMRHNPSYLMQPNAFPHWDLTVGRAQYHLWQMLSGRFGVLWNRATASVFCPPAPSPSPVVASAVVGDRRHSVRPSQPQQESFTPWGSSASLLRGLTSPSVQAAPTPRFSSPPGASGITQRHSVTSATPAIAEPNGPPPPPPSTYFGASEMDTTANTAYATPMAMTPSGAAAVGAATDFPGVLNAGGGATGGTMGSSARRNRSCSMNRVNPLGGPAAVAAEVHGTASAVASNAVSHKARLAEGERVAAAFFEKLCAARRAADAKAREDTQQRQVRHERARAILRDHASTLSRLRFVFDSEVGRGAFGAVFAARLIEVGVSQSQWMPFALKVISKVPTGGAAAGGAEPHHDHQSMLLTLAHREVTMLGRAAGGVVSGESLMALDFTSGEECYTPIKGVIPMLGSFEDAFNVYVVTELLRRGDLHTLTVAHGAPWAYDQGTPEVKLWVCTVLFEVAMAIDACHARGIHVGDVKPENVLIDDNGHAALCDFGSAAPLEEGPCSLGFGGTIHYWSPETARRVTSRNHGGTAAGAASSVTPRLSVNYLQGRKRREQQQGQDAVTRQTAHKSNYQNQQQPPPPVSNDFSPLQKLRSIASGIHSFFSSDSRTVASGVGAGGGDRSRFGGGAATTQHEGPTNSVSALLDPSYAQDDLGDDDEGYDDADERVYGDAHEDDDDGDELDEDENDEDSYERFSGRQVGASPVPAVAAARIVSATSIGRTPTITSVRSLTGVDAVLDFNGNNSLNPSPYPGAAPGGGVVTVASPVFSPGSTAVVNNGSLTTDYAAAPISGATTPSPGAPCTNYSFTTTTGAHGAGSPTFNAASAAAANPVRVANRVAAAASDWWAFGCLCHLVLFGALPLDGARDSNAAIQALVDIASEDDVVELCGGPARWAELPPFLRGLLDPNHTRRATFADIAMDPFFDGCRNDVFAEGVDISPSSQDPAVVPAFMRPTVGGSGVASASVSPGVGGVGGPIVFASGVPGAGGAVANVGEHITSPSTTTTPRHGALNHRGVDSRGATPRNSATASAVLSPLSHGFTPHRRVTALTSPTSAMPPGSVALGPTSTNASTKRHESTQWRTGVPAPPAPASMPQPAAAGNQGSAAGVGDTAVRPFAEEGRGTTSLFTIRGGNNGNSTAGLWGESSLRRASTAFANGGGGGGVNNNNSHGGAVVDMASHWMTVRPPPSHR